MRLTKRQRIIALCLGLGLVLVIALALNYHHLFTVIRKPWFNQQTLIREVRARGPLAAGLLLLLLTAVTVIPGAPNAVVAVVSGICLGAPLGFVVNVCGFSLGNLIGARLVEHLQAERPVKPTPLLTRLTGLAHPRLGLALAYALPFLPNALANVAAGRLRVQGWRLAVVIVAGALPTAFFYAFGGDAVLRLDWRRLVVAGGILVLVGLAVSWLSRRRHGEGVQS